jgi:hypothetical protein
MALSDRERRLRAELAEELGFWPATTRPEDIERHRLLNTTLDAASTQEHVSRKFQHLAEERRRTEAEESGRRDVADFYVEDRGEGA